jgi:hypothetical protein
MDVSNVIAAEHKDILMLEDLPATAMNGIDSIPFTAQVLFNS